MIGALVLACIVEPVQYRKICAAAAMLIILIATQSAKGAIGDIEFFGYKGVDVSRIRKALPVREGDAYSDEVKSAIRRAIMAEIGKEPSDVVAICCDDRGNRLLFIGLPGDSTRDFAYHPEPKGKERLPGSVIELYKSLDRKLDDAVKRGGDSAREDDSQGYALSNDPSVRELQLSVRQWAVKNERTLVSVLESSPIVRHRQAASDALGYGLQSEQQIRALVSAARDPDDEVRNNATRALGVLLRSNPKLAEKIHAETFIEMLNSGRWSDRNKAAALLDGLTAKRSPRLLEELRLKALDSMLEMAAWRRPSHAFFVRRVLGRVAGLPEERINELAGNGPIETILEAARQMQSGK